MNKLAKKLKNKLFNIIDEMENHKHLFVKKCDKDFSRKRKLSFSTMLHLLLSMNGNTLNKELLDYFNYNVQTASSSAFIQQRHKISAAALEFLFREFNNEIKVKKLYNGYRLIAVDGSDMTYAPNPKESDCFFQTSENAKGYNIVHLNAFYDLLNRTYTDAYIQPRRNYNEHKAFTAMADRYREPYKTIFIADRGYESYNNFAHVDENGYYYLIRVKDINSKGGMMHSFGFSDTEFDVDIERFITRRQTNEVKRNPDKYKYLSGKAVFDYLPSGEKGTYKIKIRAVRIKTSEDTYECLITNLPREHFDVQALKELYKMRWGIETSFRELKYSIGLANFHSKKSEFVQQEIFARLIMYNFCEMITTNVIIRNKPRKHTYQANFTMAVRICKEFFTQKCCRTPINIEALIQKYILPIRKDRQYYINKKPKSAASFIYRIA